MKNHWDFDDLGENIKKTVQDAVDAQNFSSLSQTISDVVNSALGGVTGTKRERQFDDIDLGTRQTGAQQYNAARRYDAPRYIRTGSKRVVAILLSVIGYGLGAVLLLSMLFTGLSLPVIGGTITYTALVALGVTFIPCAAAAFFGTSLLSRVKRFGIYVQTIGRAQLCNVRELAQRVRKPERYVAKDLEWMLKKNWFLQGHFDADRTCLMTTDDAYEEYLQLMKQRKDQQQADAERAAAEQKKYEQKDPRIRDVVQKGNEYIERICRCNDAIPGEEVSEKIFRMETLIRKIFARVEEEPDTVDDIKKLMNYYLPTAIKLLEAYEAMDNQPVQGENILSSKREIEDTLDTLNEAFEKLLDDMFQDTAWDVSTDVSVLKTMLAQEGLTGQDFKTGGKQ